MDRGNCAYTYPHSYSDCDDDCNRYRNGNGNSHSDRCGHGDGDSYTDTNGNSDAKSYSHTEVPFNYGGATHSTSPDTAADAYRLAASHSRAKTLILDVISDQSVPAKAADVPPATLNVPRMIFASQEFSLLLP